jgi:hypothetical protein
MAAGVTSIFLAASAGLMPYWEINFFVTMTLTAGRRYATTITQLGFNVR